MRECEGSKIGMESLGPIMQYKEREWVPSYVFLAIPGIYSPACSKSNVCLMIPDPVTLAFCVTMLAYPFFLKERTS